MDLNLADSVRCKNKMLTKKLLYGVINHVFANQKFTRLGIIQLWFIS